MQKQARRSQAGPAAARLKNPSRPRLDGIKKSAPDSAKTSKTRRPKAAAAPHLTVAALRSERGKGKRLEFLVKWAGCGEEENSWVKAIQLKRDMPDHFVTLLAEFSSGL